MLKNPLPQEIKKDLTSANMTVNSIENIIVRTNGKSLIFFIKFCDKGISIILFNS